MTFIEGVGGEFLPLAPDLLQRLAVVTVAGAALEELLFQLHHLIDEFLSHRLAERVALPACKAGQEAREEHDLLLIDGDAVRILQVALHLGDVVTDLLASLLAGDEGGDMVHRSGTIEGVHGDEVLEFRRLEFLEILLHTGRLELEGGHGASGTEEVVGQFVVDGNVIDVDHLARRLADVLDRLLDDRECLEAEEVHLDQARFFDHGAFILRHEQRLLRLLILGRSHGHDVRDVLPTDDHAAGMHTGVADIALQFLRVFQRVA